MEIQVSVLITKKNKLLPSISLYVFRYRFIDRGRLCSHIKNKKKELMMKIICQAQLVEKSILEQKENRINV
jgi:hypothetical protein